MMQGRRPPSDIRLVIRRIGHTRCVVPKAFPAVFRPNSAALSPLILGTVSSSPRPTASPAVALLLDYKHDLSVHILDALKSITVVIFNRV
jgi:hypothetical protein